MTSDEPTGHGTETDPRITGGGAKPGPNTAPDQAAFAPGAGPADGEAGPGEAGPGDASATTPSSSASVLHGLSADEAALRQRTHGANELRPPAPPGLAALVLEVVREPMFLLLLGAAALYFVMRDWGDGALLVVFVLLVIGITIVQRRRTDHALARLRVMASPRALVIRDGLARRIPGRDVVVGDLLVLDEGDRIAADARILRGGPLEVDESLLTGESVTAHKRAPPRPPAGDTAGSGGSGSDDATAQEHAVAAGTLVTSGHAIAEVVAIGRHSRLGQIGELLGELSTQRTPLQDETDGVAKRLAVFAIGVAAVVVIAHGLSRGGSLGAWRDGALVGIATAMSLLPEELPVVMTVYLAIGAWRIAQRRVLTRHMPAIEALGAATVLCVDKTGTLTQNRMSLARVVPFGHSTTLDVLAAARHASRESAADPIDTAIIQAARRAGVEGFGSCERDYPLATGLTAVGRVYGGGEGAPPRAAWYVSVKGSPEAVARLCGLHEGADATDAARSARRSLDARVAEIAGDGERVLAVAQGEWRSEVPLPDGLDGFALHLVGLVAFEDPLRTEVPQAVQEASAAGIRVVMLTGDHPDTALAIARRAGLARTGHALTGSLLASMSASELRDALGQTDVVARVAPEQKLQIVRAFRGAGAVTAMTGDGVNDAPALRDAHIGIAMGSRGSDVAREAADLVLVDDDFASIVAAIRLGRRVYANLRRAVAFILAVHVPIAGLALLPVFVPHWPILLLPAHVVLLELIIDPTCSLVFEADPGDPGIMRSPPRSLDARLFSAPLVGGAVLDGAWVFLSAAMVAAIAIGQLPEAAARAAVFIALITGFLATILVQRADGRPLLSTLATRNVALWAVLVVAPLLLVAILAIPFLRAMFAFELVDAWTTAAAIAVGLTPFGFSGLRRRVVLRREPTPA